MNFQSKGNNFNKTFFELPTFNRNFFLDKNSFLLFHSYVFPTSFNGFSLESG